ncbi:unnamed protein product, partial [marine sediment metagenome]
LNTGHYDEACDRTYIVMNLVEDALVEHPVFQKHKKMKKKIGQIQKELFKIYQVTGGLACIKDGCLEKVRKEANKKK